MIRQHAQDFIAKREAPAVIPNDGNPDSFDLVEWVLFDSHTEEIYEAAVDKTV